MKKSIIGIFILFAAAAAGQKSITDSVYTLGSVDVATDRFSNTLCGVKVDKIDSVSMRVFSAGNLSQLLMQNSSVYIKSNGIAGLSSVSVRGTGTSHTAVLWNGFNIQNPMNGGMDFSVIPVNFMNKISVQYNGMAALYGGGALGGAIHLSNEPVYGKGLDVAIGASYGSFANYSVNFKLGISRKKGALVVRAFYQEGKNDFPFINNAQYGSPKVRQTNSEMVSYGVMHDKAFRINERNQLTFRLWIQESRRQIPPLMSQEYSSVRQKDEFFRPALEWENKGKKYKMYVRTALLVDEYKYEEPDKLINSASGTTASVSEYEIYFKLFPYHTMNAGVHYKYTSGYCDYYTQKHSQQELSAFVSYTATSKTDKWKLNLAMREEYSNYSFVPLLPSFAMDIRLYKDLLMYVNFSRNYRIPTLNDLYWYPGGNTDLKPENGYAEEFGIKQHVIWNKTRLDYTVSGFNNNTQNLIIWLPESSYWSPKNIQAVWSRGAEINLKVNTELRSFILIFSGKAAYVKSTVQKSNNKSSIGHQMVYTPEWIANTGFDMIYKTFNVNFNVEYNSRRYTAYDNTDFLDPYFIGNLFASKDFYYKKFTFNVFFQVNNIWNQKYFSVAWQAMPGINFKTGVTVNFKHSLTNKKIKQ
ncbi:MAG TPA: TonB-dependent receptor [Bacteroidales bacterium]|nr:TonB-dependent receptor [Bacteroidales bacterium]HNZ42523.1 TonB-dependent receptor [Bacteroidales bacterium]HOH83298.1 TonB-dependent receptor [Bacteroidales bacterium]HPB25652.1 TonB-dependent receptor [Bacteroidales bacterium]HPI29642.1 TonB-dependent receptor [Bacteroidales bacterium]